MRPISSGGQGGGDERGESDSEDGSPLVQRALTAISVAVTLLIFSVAIWQAVSAPTTGAPTAEVVDTAALGNNTTRVTVAVTNPSAAGIESVTVQVDCTDPPTAVMFTHVPADDRRRAHVMCPRWNDSTGVSVSSWVPP